MLIISRQLASLLSNDCSSSKSNRNYCESYRSVTCGRVSNNGSGLFVNNGSRLFVLTINNRIFILFIDSDILAILVVECGVVNLSACVSSYIVSFACCENYIHRIPEPEVRSSELEAVDICCIVVCCSSVVHDSFPVKADGSLSPVKVLSVAEGHCVCLVYNKSASEEVCSAPVIACEAGSLGSVSPVIGVLAECCVCVNSIPIIVVYSCNPLVSTGSLNSCIISCIKGSAKCRIGLRTGSENILNLACSSVKCECYALIVLDSVVKNRTYVYIVLVKVAAEEVSALKVIDDINVVIESCSERSLELCSSCQSGVSSVTLGESYSVICAD